MLIIGIIFMILASLIFMFVFFLGYYNYDVSMRNYLNNQATLLIKSMQNYVLYAYENGNLKDVNFSYPFFDVEIVVRKGELIEAVIEVKSKNYNFHIRKIKTVLQNP
jgi:hypothetical protein